MMMREIHYKRVFFQLFTQKLSQNKLRMLFFCQFDSNLVPGSLKVFTKFRATAKLAKPG